MLPAHGPTALRLTATLAIPKRSGVLMVLGLNGVVVVLGALGLALPTEVAKAVAPLLVLGFLGAGGLYAARLMRVRRVALDVDHGRLAVDGGAGGAFPLAGARLGPWRTPGLGVVSGSVLHLSDGARTYRVGGAEHRPPPGAVMPPGAEASEEVEAWLALADFEALLARVPTAVAAGPWAHAPVVAAQAAATAPVRVELLPNPASARGALGTMAPWLATIGLVMLVQIVLGSTGLFDTLAGQYVGAGVTLPILIGGIAVTLWRSARRAPALHLELSPLALRLLTPAGQVVASVSPREVTVARGLHRLRMRGGATWDYPVLALGLPGHGPVTLGVYDTRFVFPDVVPTVSAPRYLVGAPDWRVLVERLCPP